MFIIIMQFLVWLALFILVLLSAPLFAMGIGAVLHAIAFGVVAFGGVLIVLSGIARHWKNKRDTRRKSK